MDEKHALPAPTRPSSGAHPPVAASVGPSQAGAAGDALPSPMEVEAALLRRAGLAVNRKGDAPQGAVNASHKAARQAPASAVLDGTEPVGYCSRWGNTVAVCDLQGQTAPEFDWHAEQEFVCMHCLQPARGLPIGFPVSVDKAPDTGVTVWCVRGRYGSFGCALRAQEERRYSFGQECGGLMALMMIRVYGIPGSKLAALQVAPARTELPPFQPALARAWAEGKLEFDGLSFHDLLNKPLGPLRRPDKARHHIASEHCALLIDAQIPREKLCKAQELRRALPTCYTRPATARLSACLPPLDRELAPP
jgi:hypothetical protein